MKKLRYFTTLVVVLFGMVSLSACDDAPGTALRIGTNVWPGYEPIYLARDLGYVDDRTFVLRQFPSATDSIRAFRNGVIDIAALTLDEALLLVENGHDIRVILVADISEGADVIVGHSRFNRLTDMRNQRVGVESNALGTFVLTRALQKNGMTLSDIQPVYLTLDESEKAFAEGRIDGVVTFEPYRTRLLREGAKELFTSKEIPGEIVDVFVVRQSLLKSRHDAITAFTTAWFKALTYLKTKPVEAAKLLAQRLKLEPAEVSASFDGLVLPDMADNRRMLGGGKNGLGPAAERLAKVMTEAKLLAGAVSVASLFDAIGLPSAEAN